MRNIFAIFLVCFGLNCYGDFDVNKFLGSVLDTAVKQGGFRENTKKQQNSSNQLYSKKNIVSQKTTDFLINRSRQYGDKTNNQIVSQPYKQTVKFLKREDVFPKEQIRAIEISPDGQRVICFVEEGKNRYLKNISNNKSYVSQIIKEKYPIDDFALFGKNILYTYYNENNILKVKAQTSLSTARQLDLPEDLKSIRFFKNDSVCLAECYDGEGYILYSIRYNAKEKRFSCKRERRLSGPIQFLFDKNLNPVFLIKNENNLTNVYFDQNRAINKSIKKEDNDVDSNYDDAVEIEEDDSDNSEDSEDLSNLILIDQIQNPNTAKYFSVDKNGNGYKASLNKAENSLLIERIKILKKDEPKITKQKIYELKNISNFFQIKINVDQNGVPVFVSVNSKRYQHFAWDNITKSHVNMISNKFNYASWYRVNTTSDGKIWLICVMSDRLASQFFLYNTKNRNFTFFQANSGNSRIYNINDYNANRLNLRSTSCHYFNSKDKEYVQMFLTQGLGSTTNSPLIIMTNSSKQYNWEYTPIVQVLANRGFNVLCLNYRKSEEDFTKALKDVIDHNLSKEKDDIDASYVSEEGNKSELSSEELEKSKNIIDESVDRAMEDISGAINWAIKNKQVKRGNIILLAEKHSIIPAIQLFLKDQDGFAGCISVDPSEDDMALISNFNFNENLKPTMILGSFNNSESIGEFLEKVSGKGDTSISVVSFNNSINQKLITGIIETFLAKNFVNTKIDPISQSDINSLQVIQDGLDLIEPDN